ncbi:MAG: MATE family efflux transporter, partial [Planctomycetota bacterium]|nr:MATE family efflux transporter [Planctomycetota bacterium]
VGAPGEGGVVGAYAPGVFQMQVEYTSIILYGAVFVLGARALSHFFFGMHRPGVIFVAMVVSNLANLAINYVLIFGHFGFPQLGVRGAAIGTAIAGAIEFLVTFAVFLGPKCHALYRTRSTWRASFSHMRDILRLGWPQALLHGNEMICWAALMAIIIGGISTIDNAAGWIALRWMMLSFMPALGMSIAVTAVVGKCIGMGRPDLAIKRTWLAVRVTMVYMGACALCFVIFRKPMIALFIGHVADPADAAMAEEILRIGASVMICAAVFQLFDAIGITVIGALRGAGDTLWPGVATAILSWTILMGGGFAMRSAFPELGSLGPWIAAATYIISFAVVMTLRFVGGRWKSIELVDRENLPELDTGDARIPELAAVGAPAMGDLDDEARLALQRLGDRPS